MCKPLMYLFSYNWYTESSRPRQPKCIFHVEFIAALYIQTHAEVWSAGEPILQILISVFKPLLSGGQMQE